MAIVKAIRGQNPSSSRASKDRSWRYKVGPFFFQPVLPFGPAEVYVHHIYTYKTLLWTNSTMYIHRKPPQIIMAGNSHQWTPCTIYCGGHCISMDSLHNLLRPATAIHGHVSRSINCGANVYRFTEYPQSAVVTIAHLGQIMSWYSSSIVYSSSLQLMCRWATAYISSLGKHV